MKVKLPADVLAAQMLNSHKRFVDFNSIQQHLAMEMLTTHIEATRKLGTPDSLKAAATDAIFLASIYEQSYEPIPSHTRSASSSLNSDYTSGWAEEL